MPPVSGHKILEIAILTRKIVTNGLVLLRLDPAPLLRAFSPGSFFCGASETSYTDIPS